MLKRLHLAAALLLACSLMLAGCSETEKDDPNVETVREAVTHLLNVPDEKSLAANYMDDEEQFKEYSQYLKNTYAPYFSGKAIDQYLLTNEFVIFHDAADRFGYEMKVGTIDVEKDPDTPTNFRFTAHLDYTGQDGEMKPIELTGVAIVRDSRIEKVSYLGDKKIIRSLLDGGLE